MSRCNGNALWFVLIAIGLLSALTLTLTRSGGDTAYDEEQAALYASRVLRQAKSVEDAVHTLMARGCSEVEINLDNELVTSYDNTLAPADDRCNVFHANGTGIAWPLMTNIGMSGSAVDHWKYTGKNQIEGVGTDCAGIQCNELTMILSIQPSAASVCEAINRMLGITPNAFPTDGDISVTPRWVGVFDASPTGVGNEAGGEGMIGKRAACFRDANEGHYEFYQVLIAR